MKNETSIFLEKIEILIDKVALLEKKNEDLIEEIKILNEELNKDSKRDKIGLYEK